MVKYRVRLYTLCLTGAYQFHLVIVIQSLYIIVLRHRSTSPIAVIPISKSREIITTCQYVRNCSRTVVWKLQTIDRGQCRASWMVLPYHYYA